MKDTGRREGRRESRKEGKGGIRIFPYRIAANKYTKNDRIENLRFTTPNKIIDLGKGH